MPVYLVRHAKAGNRSAWSGADEVRPLTKPGRVQAQAVSAWLAELPVPRVLASPYLRCVQTVEPLAALLDLKVEESEALAEGATLAAAIELLDEVPNHTVLCSHGDVILAAIEALMASGLTVAGRADWRKGATWVLQRDDAGVFTSGRVVLPPT